MSLRLQARAHMMGMSGPSLIQQTFIEQQIQSTVLDGENQDNNTASLVTSYSQANAVIVKFHSTLEITCNALKGKQKNKQ